MILIMCFTVNNRPLVEAVFRGDIPQVLEMAEATDVEKILQYEDKYNSIFVGLWPLLCAYYDCVLEWSDTMFRERNIQNMYTWVGDFLQKDTHVDYSLYPFIPYNPYDEDLDKLTIDEEEARLLVAHGVRMLDIALTNEAVQHREQKTIALLQQGATPYFECKWMHEPLEEEDYTYDYVACGLEIFESERDFSWTTFRLYHLQDLSVLSALSEEEFCDLIEGLFIYAASSRMLRIIDEYITDEARQTGIELMQKYFGDSFPIYP